MYVSTKGHCKRHIVNMHISTALNIEKGFSPQIAIHSQLSWSNLMQFIYDATKLKLYKVKIVLQRFLKLLFFFL